MKVAVVGLGKIGLPLAVQYASRGLSVFGYDIDRAKVELIRSGKYQVHGEANLEQLLRDVAGTRLTPTSNAAEAIPRAEVVVIIVPVGLTAKRRPDFSLLDAATTAIAPFLSPDALVIVETTVPVGTTRGRVGHTLGRTTLLVASPERVSSGSVLKDLATYPKIIGPIDEASWERAEAFYSKALEAPGFIRVRDPETAEFTKLAEGVYRDVNIALASELARYADSAGVDAIEAFAAANTQPYSHLHQPGVGVGGHCLPVYPYFMEDSATAQLPRIAREVNDGMAAYAVEKLEACIGNLRARDVIILGLAYRANVKEASHSSTLLIARALSERGANPLVHDPLYTPAEIEALELQAIEHIPAPAAAVVVQAWHESYHELNWSDFVGLRAVLDGRGVVQRAPVEAAGIAYIGIGR